MHSDAVLHMPSTPGASWLSSNDSSGSSAPVAEAQEIEALKGVQGDSAHSTENDDLRFSFFHTDNISRNHNVDNTFIDWNYKGSHVRSFGRNV